MINLNIIQTKELINFCKISKDLKVEYIQIETIQENTLVVSFKNAIEQLEIKFNLEIVQENDKIVVDSTDFCKILNCIDINSISLIKEENTLLIQQNNDNYNCSTIKDKEINSFDFKAIENNSFDLKELPTNFKNIQKYMDKKGYRPVLESVYFNINKNECTMVATNAVIMKVIKTETKSINDFNFIVNSATVNLIAKHFTKFIDSVKISVFENYVCFTFGNITITSKLVNERYPTYTAIIPQNNDSEATINTKKLVPILKKAIKMKSFNDQILISFLNNKAIIKTAEKDQKTQYKTSLNCEFSSEEIIIQINCKYLLLILQEINEDEVLFCMSTPTRPILIQSYINNDISIIMPVNQNR